MRHLPNLLTLLRMLLSVPISFLLLSERFNPALGLFAVAALSDALDGLLARRFGWSSQLGAMLDPLADKLLLLCTCIALLTIEAMPWWLGVLIFGRDLIIVSGAGAYRYLLGNLQFRPTWLGKLCTLGQVILVLVLVLALGPVPALSLVVPGLIGLVALLTVASGLHYIWRWSGYYRQARQGG